MMLCRPRLYEQCATRHQPDPQPTWIEHTRRGRQCCKAVQGRARSMKRQWNGNESAVNRQQKVKGRQ